FRTMSIQPYLWNFILKDMPAHEISRVDLSLYKSFQQMSSWKNFHILNYRSLISGDNNTEALLISAASLKKFWSTSMLLQTRDLWYRTFSKKLPTTSFLHIIGTVESPNCRLCGNSNIDTLDHFLLYCPLKQEIWSSVLLQYFSTPPLTATETLTTLLTLTPPTIIGRTQIPTLYTIVAITHWTIWIHYWNFIIDKKLFLATAILTSIHSQVSLIL
ncbi:hypothetical protein BD770DRAFT_297500, partial [Pilaira anomala]